MEWSQVKFIFPMIPLPLNKFWSGMQHWDRTAHKKEVHHLVHMLCRLEEFSTWDGQMLEPPIMLTCRYYLPTKRVRDIDSFVIKPFLDALVDEGVIPDDRWTFIPKKVDECYLDRKNPRFEMIFQELWDGANIQEL